MSSCHGGFDRQENTGPPPQRKVSVKSNEFKNTETILSLVILMKQ